MIRELDPAAVLAQFTIYNVSPRLSRSGPGRARVLLVWQMRLLGRTLGPSHGSGQ